MLLSCVCNEHATNREKENNPAAMVRINALTPGRHWMLMHNKLNRFPEESSVSNCSECVFLFDFIVFAGKMEALTEDEQIVSCHAPDR